MEQKTTPMDEVPVIDVLAYMTKEKGKWQQECEKVAYSLHKYGIIVFKDPRFSENENQ
jgi:hypothetical protein